MTSSRASSTTDTVRLATEGDLSGIAVSLARAFFDDPVSSWMVPEDDRHERLVRMFKLMLDFQFRVGHIYTTSDTVGTSMWSLPGNWRLDLKAMNDFAGNVFDIFGDNLDRALEVVSTLEDNHPQNPPHWYLGALGTHPDWQGRGIGTALLMPILARADAEQSRVFLESSKERNVPYYHRFGFEVVGELTIPGGGPTLWPMWRDPRPVESSAATTRVGH